MILTLVIASSPGKDLRYSYQLSAGSAVPREGDTVSTPDRACARITAVNWHFDGKGKMSPTVIAR